MMVENKRIAIYGGAFSPPTLAHQWVVAYLTSSSECKGMFDELWVVPSFKHTLKGNSSMTYELRREMCNIMIDSSVLVMDIDKDACASGADGSTRSVIEYLRTIYPNYSFSMIIGQDNADEMDKWKHPEWLKENVSFIVVNRGGRSDPDVHAWYMTSPHTFVHIDSPVLSSTMVREAISRDDWELVETYVGYQVCTILKKEYQR